MPSDTLDQVVGIVLGGEIEGISLNVNTEFSAATLGVADSDNVVHMFSGTNCVELAERSAASVTFEVDCALSGAEDWQGTLRGSLAFFNCE